MIVKTMYVAADPDGTVVARIRKPERACYLIDNEKVHYWRSVAFSNSSYVIDKDLLPFGITWEDEAKLVDIQIVNHVEKCGDCKIYDYHTCLNEFCPESGDMPEVDRKACGKFISDLI